MLNEFVFEGLVVEVKEFNKNGKKSMLAEVGQIGFALSFFAPPEMLQNIRKDQTVICKGKLNSFAGSIRLRLESITVKK